MHQCTCRQCSKKDHNQLCKQCVGVMCSVQGQAAIVLHRSASTADSRWLSICLYAKDS